MRTETVSLYETLVPIISLQYATINNIDKINSVELVYKLLITVLRPNVNLHSFLRSLSENKILPMAEWSSGSELETVQYDAEVV